MFVRWQSYKSIASWNRRKPVIKRCKAILVESIRVNGQPRQQHIAFIASYSPADLARPDSDWNLWTRRCFWKHARRRLNELSKQKQITPQQRKKIEADLARRVRPTTKQQDQSLEREFAEGWARHRPPAQPQSIPRLRLTNKRKLRQREPVEESWVSRATREVESGAQYLSDGTKVYTDYD
jgi:hypothetical protein